MKNKKLKRLSIINLIIGYITLMLFSLLVILNQPTELMAEDQDLTVVKASDEDKTEALEPPDEVSSKEKEIIYIDGHPTTYIRDNSIGVDRLSGVIVDNVPNRLVERDDLRGNIAIARDTRNENLLIDRRDNIIIDETIDRHNYSNRTGASVDDRLYGVRNNSFVDNKNNRRDRLVEDIDAGILDRRLNEANLFEENTEEVGEDFGLDGNDFAGFTLAEDEEGELDFDIDDFKNADMGSKGYGVDKGNLYAYNYPSQGVGAGIGNAGVGAAAGFAGIGAGVGQAVLNGETVPTLGGVGTSPIIPGNLEVTPENDRDGDGLPASIESQIGTNPNNADTDGDGLSDGDEVFSYSNPLDKTSTPLDSGSAPLPQFGGVGGLVSGAGSGVAAGLVTGMVKKQLGIGIAPKGCAECGGECKGHGHGHGRGKHEYDLPPDGALHIMIHVDGSGSILATRRQLDIMKDTLMKDALLPYYNNDESLYNKRVTIMDNSGERTLRFYTEAAKKDNVLAIAFQDEAAPDYHLPNFNKAPQNAYSADLGKLRSNLNGYGGLYRGIMFQVDRGRTFAKSFKELVECAWNGEGYLEKPGTNLKKYHRDNNLHNIKNKNGIVFSDEYHAKSEGDPQYYLDLIFKASKRVGLDLQAKGAGLTDGKYNQKID
tara:strand:- start:54129 stop:56093 length:1965 start_codon:yes stop_codon:yes gene_type:complete